MEAGDAFFGRGHVHRDDLAAGFGQGAADRRAQSAESARDQGDACLRHASVPQKRRRPVSRDTGLRSTSSARAGLRRVARGLGLGGRGGAAHAAAEVALEFLPHLHVALGQLVHHGPRRLPEQVAHLAAELRLLLHEQLHAALQVVAHEALQRVAVETDDLAEQLRRQDRFAILFLLRDDLKQDRAGQVVAGLGVADLEVLSVDDQLADVFDGDVAGDLGVVETAVGVLLDDPGRSHGAIALIHSRRSMTQRNSSCNGSGISPPVQGRPGDGMKGALGRLRVCRPRSGHQPMWWPPLMSRFEPVIQAARSSTRKPTA